MPDTNAVQREATAQWYREWLKQRFTEPVFEKGKLERYECSLSKDQIESMAAEFATQQNPLPVIPENETDEEKAAREHLDNLRQLAYAYTRREMAGEPR